MDDYSEFPTTPTGLAGAALPDSGRRSSRCRPRPAPARRGVDLVALVPGVVFVVAGRRGPGRRDLPSARCSGTAGALGPADRRRRPAARPRTPQGPPAPQVSDGTAPLQGPAPSVRGVGGSGVLYSHSMVPGGLLVTSRTTRLTSAHLVGDAGGDPRQHVVGQPGPVGGHRVLAGHRPQHDRVAVGAAVALHADRPDVGQQHDRALPDLAVEPGGGQLGAGDRVGLRAGRRAAPG